MNHWVAGYEVDLLWPEHGVVVGIDSFEHHGTRRAFERDRVRDAELGDANLRVRRVTWRQIEEGRAVIERIRRALG